MSSSKVKEYTSAYEVVGIYLHSCTVTNAYPSNKGVRQSLEYKGRGDITTQRKNKKSLLDQLPAPFHPSRQQNPRSAPEPRPFCRGPAQSPPSAQLCAGATRPAALRKGCQGRGRKRVSRPLLPRPRPCPPPIRLCAGATRPLPRFEKGSRWWAGAPEPTAHPPLPCPSAEASASS